MNVQRLVISGAIMPRPLFLPLRPRRPWRGFHARVCPAMPSSQRAPLARSGPGNRRPRLQPCGEGIVANDGHRLPARSPAPRYTDQWLAAGSFPQQKAVPQRFQSVTSTGTDCARGPRLVPPMGLAAADARNLVRRITGWWQPGGRRLTACDKWPSTSANIWESG